MCNAVKESVIKLSLEEVSQLCNALCIESVACKKIDYSIASENKNLTILSKRPDIFSKIMDYRKNLLEAIISQQPKKAWGASHRHLAFIEEVLLKLTQENSRMERSMRRM